MPAPESGTHILAIDPGEKVGWAHGWVRHSDGTLVVQGHGIQPLWPFAAQLEDDLEWEAYSVVIYERWRLSAAHAKALIGNDMQTSQLIGVIRFLARRAGVKLVAQDPKDWHHGKTVAPPTVSSILDTLPKSHDESHDGPALCHLAHYWFVNYFDPTKEPA